MIERRHLSPLAVVATTDILLVLLSGGPWAVQWGTVTSAEVYTVHSNFVYPLVSPLILPLWGEPESLRMLALYMDRWRIGTCVRIVVFLLLHLWVAHRLMQRDTTAGGWRAARGAAWTLGPAVGALAGLATLVPAALDWSVTVEERADLRVAGVISLEEGAYWGLVAGAACWITLTATRLVSRDVTSRGRFADPDRTFTPRQVGRLLGRALRAGVAGLVVGGALLAVLGGRRLFLATQPSSPASAYRPSWAELVTYIHWWSPPASVRSPQSFFAGTVAPLALYFWALLILLTISALAARMGPPLRRLTSGWHAVTWAILLYTMATAWYTTFTLVTPGANATAVLRAVAENFLTDLDSAATYTAVLGWMPALAMVVASHRSPTERGERPGRHGSSTAFSVGT